MRTLLCATVVLCLCGNVQATEVFRSDFFDATMIENGPTLTDQYWLWADNTSYLGYSDQSQVFMKFDMPELVAPAGQSTVINSAELWVYFGWTYPAHTFDKFAIFETADSWNAGTTWATKPAAGAQIGSSFNAGPSSAPENPDLLVGRVVIDVKDYLQANANAGDNVVSFILDKVLDVAGDPYNGAVVYSRNITADSRYPRLTLDYSYVVPEPATIGLLGLGALTLIRRKK